LIFLTLEDKNQLRLLFFFVLISYFNQNILIKTLQKAKVLQKQ